MKKKVISLFLAAVMACMTVACGSSASGTAEKEEDKQEEQQEAAAETVELAWNLPDPEGHPWTDTAKEIAEKIEERSGGTLKVTVYPNNQMGQVEAVEMMANGSLAMDLAGAAAFAGYYAPAEILTLPYTFEDADQGYAYFESDYGKELFQTIEDASGIMTLDLWYFGDRELTTKGVDVNVPADLKGVPIRCMDSTGSKCVIESLGGSPVPMALAETYLSLQTGTVKGQENPLPTIIAQKFTEVQDHIIMTHHSVHMGTVNFSKKIWDTLTAEQQVILDTLAEYRPIVTQRINDKQDADLEELKKAGMTVQEVDLEAFRANAQQIVSSTYGSDPEWAKVIENLEKFKEEYKGN